MKVQNKIMAHDENYMLEWMKINNLLSTRGMTWSTTLNETLESNYEEDEYCQYVILSLLKMKKDQINKSKEASEEIYAMLQEVVDKFYQLPLSKKQTILKDLKFSDYYIDMITKSDKMDLFSYFCRFDLVWDNALNQYKCIEFNSDTPTGLVETGMVNTVINDYHKTQSLNSAEIKLTFAWNNLRNELNLTKNDIIYFSALGENDEDRLNVEFNRMHSDHLGQSKFVALEDILVTPEGLFDEHNNQIKYWYALFPKEYWEFEENDRNLILKDLVETNQLVIINPMSAFLVQNKLFYALLWSLTHQNFLQISEKSIDTISNYLLPTYSNQKDLLKYNPNMKHVEKPVFGREGNCVTIFEGQNIIFKDIEHDTTEYYGNQDMIYQQFIELPKIDVETWDGNYNGSLLTGSYMIGGKWSGLYNRVGHEITGNQSLFIAYTEEEN